jgi:hypothetical protein
MRIKVAGIVLSMTLFAVAGAGAKETESSSCLKCHSSADSSGEESAALVKAFENDVHRKAGLSCHDCHGGNPAPELAEDIGAAMDSSFAPAPFVGSPDRRGTPEFCGRCHSSLAYMRRYSPAARVDQVSEYWTSRHGERLRSGDEAVASCIDCHGVHGIRRVTDPASPVHPARVAETCGGCHSDAKRMAGRKDGSGRALPIDQFAKWRRSVHAEAMIDKGDLSAPTCNDCHGNHGAKPPGVASVANVCGQCHGREAELFRQSAKAEGFAAHNELMSGAEEGCASCHEGLAPTVASLSHFGECATCHENHAVIRPTIALIGFLPETPCAFCHEGTPADQKLEPEKRRRNFTAMRDTLLREAESRGLRGDERFDWLVEQALTLPTHVVRSDDEAEKRLRPEFARLFEKFRIGSGSYVYADPVTGQPKRERVRRCTDCHVEDGKGRRAAQSMLAAMSEVGARTARAERILLAAKRGGVEVGAVHSELDAAVDRQIELEVLVHSFSAEGAFGEKRKEATMHAGKALEAGRKALAELSYRRNGLTAALGVIVLALLGLGLKIREVSRRRP